MLWWLQLSILTTTYPSFKVNSLIVYKYSSTIRCGFIVSDTEQHVSIIVKNTIIKLQIDMNHVILKQMQSISKQIDKSNRQHLNHKN